MVNWQYLGRQEKSREIYWFGNSRETSKYCFPRPTGIELFFTGVPSASAIYSKRDGPSNFTQLPHGGDFTSNWCKEGMGEQTTAPFPDCGRRAVTLLYLLTHVGPASAVFIKLLLRHLTLQMCPFLSVSQKEMTFLARIDSFLRDFPLEPEVRFYE